MSEIFHLIIDKGPTAGRKITIPPDGARLGRSSRNDIVVEDPVLSRHHCRFFFKTNDGLWVTDLGSANQTMVNNQTITEVKLNIGDVISVGDTVLKVIDAGFTDAAIAAGTPPKQDPKQDIDLGLSTNKDPSSQALTSKRKILYLLLVLVIASCAAIWMPKLTAKKPVKKRPVPAVAIPDSVVEVSYEKVQASGKNIFRYAMTIKDNKLSVEINDIESGKQVSPKEKNLDPALLKDLAESLKGSGFFELESKYAGVQPDTYDLYDLTITMGVKTHTVKVLNKVEPDEFKKAAEILENFSKNELGLVAIQYSPEKLKEMAQESYDRAKKLFEDKDIAYGNLSDAIRNCKEAVWYLETLETKPEFYNDLLAIQKDSEEELQKRYDDVNFRAKKAIKLQQWEEAAKELRIIRDMVPDKGDKRYQNANADLLDVERRLSNRK